MIEWKLEKRLIKTLKPHPANPRRLSKHDAKHLQKSLEKFGLIDKPVIMKDGSMIGGHQRVAILKKMGHKEVECWVADEEMTIKDINELNIRLNRNTGEFDWEILANEWETDELMEWGFTPEEMMIDSKETANAEESEGILEPPKIPKSVLGDCYRLDCDGDRGYDSVNPNNVSVYLGNAEECDILINEWINYRKKIGKDATVMKNGQVYKDFDG